MVMISMTRSTSKTSINGFVFISIMTSVLSLDPTFIAIGVSSFPFSLLRRRTVWLGDKPDLLNGGALQIHDDPSYGLEAHILVGPNMHFGLWLHYGDLPQLCQQHVIVIEPGIVPVHVFVGVDGNDDVFRFGLRRNIRRLRKFDRHRLDDYRNGDEEDDQQHQHDIDKRRRVDSRGDLVFVFQRADIHGHGMRPLKRTDSSQRLARRKVCRSLAKARSFSLMTLLRRTRRL